MQAAIRQNINASGLGVRNVRSGVGTVAVRLSSLLKEFPIQRNEICFVGTCSKKRDLLLFFAGLCAIL